MANLHPLEVSMMNITLDELIEDELDYEQKLKLRDMCGPAIKNYLLQKSLKALLNGQHLESIYYETAVLSIWTIFKYNAQAFDPLKKILFNKKQLTNLVDVVKPPVFNDFDEFCQSELSKTKTSPEKMMKPKTEIQITKEIYLSDRIKVVESMCNQCKLLPKEWTVIQITKRYNVNKLIQLVHEQYSSNQPLHLTIFSYERLGVIYSEPITIYLFDPKVNIYKDGYKMSNEINSDCKRQSRNELLNIQLQEHIKNLNKFLSPWFVLFSGKIKSTEGKLYEKQIFEKVDQFIVDSLTLKFSKRQHILISLIARRIDLLSADQLNTAALQISQNSNQYKSLTIFFKDLKIHNLKSFKSFNYYPTIFIIDETIDFMKWEMCLPQQETSRVSSLTLLFRLYGKYKNQIKNGYLNVKTENGYVLCNPDTNLPAMEQRLKPMINEYFPKYNCTIGNVPTNDELKTNIEKTDVYIYAGHGSSLQFISPFDLCKFDLHCVAFLFGCESIGLKCVGSQSEAIGAHLYLNYALCPSVFGAINVITDLWTDVYTFIIFSKWFAHPNDKLTYKIPESIKGLHAEILTNFMKLPINSNLLAILVLIRCDMSIPLRMRSVMVCRGIPVVNSSL